MYDCGHGRNGGGGKAHDIGDLRGDLAPARGAQPRLRCLAGGQGRRVAGAAGKAGAAGGILKGFLPAIEIVAGIGAVATEILGIAWVDTKILKANIDNIIAITDGMQTVFDNVKGLTSSGIDMGAVGDAVWQEDFRENVPGGD